jgi:hypothetical protein
MYNYIALHNYISYDHPLDTGNGEASRVSRKMTVALSRHPQVLWSGTKIVENGGSFGQARTEPGPSTRLKRDSLGQIL